MAGFLTEVEGFTPVIDAIVQDVGLMGAVVYGVMWRYFQMSDGVCKASLQQIANRIGMNRSTVLRHAKNLCKKGYVIDLTPQARNKPHIYADAGLAKIQGLLEARRVAENNRCVAESNSLLQRATEHCREQQTVAESNATVAESHLKRVFKESIEDSLEDSMEENGPSQKAGADAPPPPSEPKAEPKKRKDPSPKQQAARDMFEALAKACQINLTTITGTQRKQLNQSEKILRKDDALPADLELFPTWWYANDWRGKKGDAPRPAQVRETWGQFKTWREEGQRGIENEPAGFEGIREWGRQQGVTMEGP